MSGSGISWAVWKSAPCSRQTTPPAPHHSVFYRPDALPAVQPTASKHWRQQISETTLTVLYYMRKTGSRYLCGVGSLAGDWRDQFTVAVEHLDQLKVNTIHTANHVLPLCVTWPHTDTYRQTHTQTANHVLPLCVTWPHTDTYRLPCAASASHMTTHRRIQTDRHTHSQPRAASAFHMTMHRHIQTDNNNNNNDHLTAFDPGQPG